MIEPGVHLGVNGNAPHQAPQTHNVARNMYTMLGKEGGCNMKKKVFAT
jgi:hypothetical protein